MIEYKPRIPGRIDVKKANITFMVPELEIFRKLADKITGRKIFECGNPRCGGKIVLEKNKPRPKTCGECHEKIDWIGFS